MTRSEMVIELMINRGATLAGEALSSSIRKKEESSFIHWGDIRIEVGKTSLYIEEKLQRQVLYQGLIPPSQPRFLELMTWIGVVL